MQITVHHTKDNVIPFYQTCTYASKKSVNIAPTGIADESFQTGKSQCYVIQTPKIWCKENNLALIVLGMADTRYE